MIYKIFYLSISLLMLCNVSAQSNYDKSIQFEKTKLLEDISYLEKLLTEGHPGLNWYSSESDLSVAFRQIESALKPNMTELGFLNQVAKLNNIIKCVHSDIRPSLQYNKYWKDSVNLIPINIMKVNSEYFVYQNFSESQELSFGTKLISINDVPMADIVAHLLPFIPADGDNQTRKYYALRSGFYRYYSYYVDATSKTFKLAYENGNGELLETTIEGIKKDDFDNKRKSLKQTKFNYSPVSFQILDSNSTALLTIRTFRNDLMEDANIIFKDFISSCFNLLHESKTENLIIDLRDNGGGYSEYAAVLYSFLSTVPFEYCKNQFVTTDKLIEGVEYDIPATFEGYPNGIVHENGQYKWLKHSVLGWRDPAEHHFSGNVYFLINGGCSSTTSELASLARSNDIGTFIGEEVGGCYAGNSGGVLGWFELPNTKLRVRMAMVKYEITDAPFINKQGVVPDFKVDYSIEDLIEEKDLEIELTFKKIKEQNTTINKRY